MAMTQANFADLIDPAISKILFSRFAKHTDQYKDLYDVRTSTRAWEKESTVTGVGVVPQKLEGQDYTEDTPVQGYDTTYTHVSYGLRINITLEMQQDELFGIIGKMAQALGRSMIETVEIEGANMLNRAFNASYVGPDGLTLCNTAHLGVKSGATISNQAATNSDLTLSALEQALIDGRNMVNDSGIITPVYYKALIVPAELEFVAKRLLNSEKMPGTAQNDLNVVRDRGIKLIVNDYLTDTDAWFMRVGDEDLSCPFYWRQKPLPRTDRDVNSDNIIYKLFARFCRGWTDYRDYYGTPGA